MNKVSLIIPTFNRPHLLPRAVESARRAGREVEVIVVDDASTDHTAEMCAALRDIKYVRLDRNQGVAGARNVGAEALPRGAFRFASSNFFIALWLSPLWAARPTYLRLLWRSAATLLLTRFKNRRAPTSAAVNS